MGSTPPTASYSLRARSALASSSAMARTFGSCCSNGSKANARHDAASGAFCARSSRVVRAAAAMRTESGMRSPIVAESTAMMAGALGTAAGGMLSAPGTVAPSAVTAALSGVIAARAATRRGGATSASTLSALNCRRRIRAAARERSNVSAGTGTRCSATRSVRVNQSSRPNVTANVTPPTPASTPLRCTMLRARPAIQRARGNVVGGSIRVFTSEF